MTRGVWLQNKAKAGRKDTAAHVLDSAGIIKASFGLNRVAVLTKTPPILSLVNNSSLVGAPNYERPAF